jgi:gliding motility-associated-like protein
MNEGPVINFVMRKLRLALLSGFIAVLLHVSSFAQDSGCENLNFGSGNFTNWVGYTWRYSTMVPSINTSKVKGIVGRRQAIMSDTTAYDANTGYALKKIPSGYLYSARLGDAIVNGDENPRCWNQSLDYTMTIDSSNALVVIKFALVLQYASDHNATNEPRFRFTLFDAHGDTIPDCSNYDVYSSNQNIEGFKTYTPAGSKDPVKWRDWTTVGADLSRYIGQTITIELMAADCNQRYHYGYAYVVAECHPLYITVNYCSGDSTASLTAPEGFESYQWKDSTGTVVDTSQILDLSDPQEGDVYKCIMTSATGCTVSLQSTIARYVLSPDFSSYMIDCFSNIVQMVNLSTTTHGTIKNTWDFGDGILINSTNPRYTFATSGIHTVTLMLANPPSTCKDTLTKDVESFSPPLVGITGDSTYCPGLSVTLDAYGAYEYTWSNGSTSDSIEVSAPGGGIWLVGHSSTGCISDTIRKSITEEPDWSFLSSSDTTFCLGDTLILSASGAVKYYWNTGDTLNAIVVNQSGNYAIIGTNVRGCEKSVDFHVIRYPLPQADFDVSSHHVDSRHNQITCIIPAADSVQYLWNLGDGSSETGSTVQHAYQISDSVLSYTISLMAVSLNGCSDSSSQVIDVTPFIPNAFTPDGDGINDFFMPGIRLKIYDRNGMMLYEGAKGWDGKYKDRSVNPDTYFYLVSYDDSKGQLHEKRGFITLIR